MSDTEDTDWRADMYARKTDDRSVYRGPVGMRSDQHSMVPTLSYVQSLEKLLHDVTNRLAEAEAKIKSLEMHIRTTRDAVRKNASVLSEIAKDVDGKLDAP
jgi:hypothetical protein